MLSSSNLNSSKQAPIRCQSIRFFRPVRSFGDAFLKRVPADEFVRVDPIA